MTFRLDFNHGALKKANDPRTRGISERINIHIDAALFRAAMRFGPTSIRCLTNKSSMNATGSPTQGTAP
jgi:hypothetical protein